MSKRVSSGIPNQAKKTKHWSMGLLESMKDPESIVKETTSLVVIKDKYPKAKIHYLVLPKNSISSIYKLDKSHLTLLEQFSKIYEELCSKHEESVLKAGFHAVPSMQHLHLHIISQDMVSPCLKTKVHWNSFTTSFFLLLKGVQKEINDNGFIKKIESEDHKNIMATPLVCNQCTFVPKNMPQLKEHLLTHTQYN